MTLTLLLTVALLVAVALLVREHRRNTRKVRFLLDAVSAGDYTFKFQESGRPRRYHAINADLNRIANIMQTARNEAIEREKYYELIINQVNTGILVVDERGNVLQSNSEARRLLGLEVLTHTKQLARVDEALEKTVETLRPNEKTRATLLNERGNVDLQLRASATTLRGKPVHIIALNDINAEMDDNQQEAWNKLIRVLTHEIMNAVTPITSLSETLLDKTPDGETRTGLATIHQTSRDLLNFVESYRRLTHVPTPAPQLFYVRQFAERMRSIALEQPHTDGIQIAIDVKPADLLVYADESLVTHVVTNLLKNAIQAFAAAPDEGNTTQQEPTGKHIWLHAYTNNEEAVIIDIANDGPLIPPDVADHIFVPFFTTKQDGSGIGLSVSRQIMKLSGGTLTLKSDQRRHLTTFTLTFP